MSSLLYLAYGIVWLFRFALGACVFSFLNVVAARLPRGESILRGRSHCEECGHTLAAWELIPCISFLLLGGKCHACGARLSPRYVLTETLGGALSCACALRFGGETAQAALAFASLCILTVVALMDWDTMEIWDRFNILLALCGAAAFFVFPEVSWRSRIIGLFAISVPMLVLALVIPGGFGGGDIKLMAAAGLLLGWQSAICAVLFGILTGGAYGIALLARRKAGRRDHFAFGPFLCFGAAIALFFGQDIVNWYIGLLF